MDAVDEITKSKKASVFAGERTKLPACEPGEPCEVATTEALALAQQDFGTGSKAGSLALLRWVGAACPSVDVRDRAGNSVRSRRRTGHYRLDPAARGNCSLPAI